jgi:iron(III) transport system substrate-binding protein
MKKLLSLVLALAMLLCAVPALADVAADVEAGQALTHDELVEKALAETGDFVVYGNTSRIATALESFAELYKDIPCPPANNLKDQEIYTKLRNESGSTAADMVMIQDGAQLTDAIDEGLVINFVPAAVKDVLDEADQQPALVHQYINKLFIYNNLGESVPAIKNVWELTAPEMKGNVIFKNPESEKVNMNFLVMCTKPEWADKLAEAYKAWKGEDIDLGSYENAGYKWVAEFLDNVTFGKSDTSIAEEVSQETASGKIGLFVLSKLRSSSVLTDNLTVAQYDATANGYAVEPFSGFMYPMYTMVNTKATRPYTAMLFIEYLMTQEGFQPWGKSIGAYSPNPAITVNEGDLTIDVWKASLVMEDAEYILDSFEVEDFILQHCQN